MKVLRATRVPKTLVGGGKWQNGKMPNTAFPLSKGRGYRLGSTWSWCVYTVECGKDRYRLLIAFEPAKEQYQAWLALDDGADQALIARLEYHPSHRGWHCHLKPGLVKNVPRGTVKMSGERVAECAPGDFNVTELNAVGIAFRVFCVASANVGLLQ